MGRIGMLLKCRWRGSSGIVQTASSHRRLRQTVAIYGLQVIDVVRLVFLRVTLGVAQVDG